MNLAKVPPEAYYSFFDSEGVLIGPWCWMCMEVRYHESWLRYETEVFLHTPAGAIRIELAELAVANSSQEPFKMLYETESVPRIWCVNTACKNTHSPMLVAKVVCVPVETQTDGVPALENKSEESSQESPETATLGTQTSESPQMFNEITQTESNRADASTQKNLMETPMMNRNGNTGMSRFAGVPIIKGGLFDNQPPMIPTSILTVSTSVNGKDTFVQPQIISEKEKINTYKRWLIKPSVPVDIQKEEEFRPLEESFPFLRGRSGLTDADSVAVKDLEFGSVIKRMEAVRRFNDRAIFLNIEFKKPVRCSLCQTGKISFIMDAFRHISSQRHIKLALRENIVLSRSLDLNGLITIVESMEQRFHPKAKNNSSPITETPPRTPSSFESFTISVEELPKSEVSNTMDASSNTSANAEVHDNDHHTTDSEDEPSTAADVVSAPIDAQDTRDFEDAASTDAAVVLPLTEVVATNHCILSSVGPKTQIPLVGLFTDGNLKSDIVLNEDQIAFVCAAVKELVSFETLCQKTYTHFDFLSDCSICNVKLECVCQKLNHIFCVEHLMKRQQMLPSSPGLSEFLWWRDRLEAAVNELVSIGVFLPYKWAKSQALDKLIDLEEESTETDSQEGSDQESEEGASTSQENLQPIAADDEISRHIPREITPVVSRERKPEKKAKSKKTKCHIS